MTVFPRAGVLATIAAVALATSAGSARADIIDIAGGAGDPGAFTGTIEVNYTPGSSTAQVIITLSNTSPVDNGGFITGFAFNNPGTPAGGNITSASLTTDSAAFQSLGLTGTTVTGDINGQPYGTFDLGAALGGNFQGGGSPNSGIGVGVTGTFTFTVGGTNLENLSAESILGTPSSNGTASFVVRFRGFEDDDSDKVVAIGTKTPGNGGAVPAPPGVVLAGLGIACCLFGRVSRRKQPAAA